jgi:hypothetical protein
MPACRASPRGRHTHWSQHTNKISMVAKWLSPSGCAWKSCLVVSLFFLLPSVVTYHRTWKHTFLPCSEQVCSLCSYLNYISWSHCNCAMVLPMEPLECFWLLLFLRNGFDAGPNGGMEDNQNIQLSSDTWVTGRIYTQSLSNEDIFST